MNMPKIPPDKIQEIVERHNNGESYRDLAPEFNVQHTTIMRNVKKHKTSPEPPHVFHGFKRYDKVNLLCDVDFPYHSLKKGEEVQIIDFDKPENTALVTSHQYGQALDLPIDALEICDEFLKSRQQQEQRQQEMDRVNAHPLNSAALRWILDEATREYSEHPAGVEDERLHLANHLEWSLERLELPQPIQIQDPRRVALNKLEAEKSPEELLAWFQRPDSLQEGLKMATDVLESARVVVAEFQNLLHNDPDLS